MSCSQRIKEITVPDGSPSKSRTGRIVWRPVVHSIVTLPNAIACNQLATRLATVKPNQVTIFFPRLIAFPRLPRRHYTSTSTHTRTLRGGHLLLIIRYQLRCISIMASFFNFAGQPVEVEIKLTGEAERRQVEVKGDKEKKEMCPVYYDGESVVGQVSNWYLFLAITPEKTCQNPLSQTLGHSEGEGRAKIPTRRDPYRAHRLNRQVDSLTF